MDLRFGRWHAKEEAAKESERIAKIAFPLLNKESNPDIEKGLGSVQTFGDLCTLARSKILDSCPNVKKISVKGLRSNFSFCSRNSLRGWPMPLLGWASSSLKSIELIRQDQEPPTLSSKNIIWIIVNLPFLVQADLFGSLDMEDVRFTKNHSEGLKKCHSSLIKLRLHLFIHTTQDP